MNPDATVEPDKLIADAIDGAEEIPDPLAELVERTATNPGAPSMPEALEALAALKSDNRAAFEALRSQLKKAGCRVTALDDAIAEERGDTGGRGPTQADILNGLAQTAELFHAADGAGFADLDINGHRETWPIRAKGFRRWLARRFFEETGGAPSSEALQSALNVIEAKAHFDAPERQVHIRVGGLDGRLYLDLGDATWRAVEIDATGWRVIENPLVRFRRASGMKPMPVPVRGGSIETLRSFLNLQTDADFVLVVAWGLACLRNRGPYPVIVLSGEQGSAKSTFSAILRALLDPNTAPLRALPREDRDLFIAASNGHVLAFDNVSGLPAWIGGTEEGRILGGREKSIIAMRLSVENTVKNANGQIVQRVLKIKELRMTSAELEKLIASLLDLQDNRCALTGIPFQFLGREADKNLLPSLDRIDSAGHYEVGNLQVVCQFINFWKGDSDNSEFQRLLMLIRGVEQ